MICSKCQLAFPACQGYKSRHGEHSMRLIKLFNCRVVGIHVGYWVDHQVGEPAEVELTPCECSGHSQTQMLQLSVLVRIESQIINLSSNKQMVYYFQIKQYLSHLHGRRIFSNGLFQIKIGKQETTMQVHFLTCKHTAMQSCISFGVSLQLEGP